MVEVDLAGDDLPSMGRCDPAASVRLLVPRRTPLEIPTWSGNEFLFADGTRPPIRTLTPRHVDPDSGRMTVAVVDHDDGALVRWVRALLDGPEGVGADDDGPGDDGAGRATAVSGFGRGVDVASWGSRVLLVGDESALPAIATLLDALPADTQVTVLAEVHDPRSRWELPEHPSGEVRWLAAEDPWGPGGAMAAAVEALPPDAVTGADVWVAGEAAAVQRIRADLFGRREVPRRRATVRGYWKHGRPGVGT